MWAAAWLAPAAHAHKPSDSYLTLSVVGDRIEGQWDIALRDLDYALSLDTNQNGEITWGEVKAKHAEIAAYAFAHLRVGPASAPCAARGGEQLIDNHSDGAYSVLRFTATCAAVPKTLVVDYRLFFELDPQHRASSVSTTQTPHLQRRRTRTAIPAADLSRWEQFLDYGNEGVWHIWTGFDHVFPAVAAPARGARPFESAARGEPAASQRGLLGCRQGRHRVHPGAFDHAVARGARRCQLAVAMGRVGDCAIRRARRAQQRSGRSSRQGWVIVLLA
jgi:hypothetical protein